MHLEFRLPANFPRGAGTPITAIFNASLIPAHIVAAILHALDQSLAHQNSVWFTIDCYILPGAGGGALEYHVTKLDEFTIDDQPDVLAQSNGWVAGNGLANNPQYLHALPAPPAPPPAMVMAPAPAIHPPAMALPPPPVLPPPVHPDRQHRQG